MTMAALVTPARVIPSLRAQDKRQVVRELARVAASAARLDQDVVLQAVAARADLTSFGLGRGVAIPHAMVAGLERPLGVFARLDPAIDFGAVDGRPADLVFLLLSPAGDEGTLLRALSCAARRLRDRDTRSRVRSALGAEAIHVVLTGDSWRGADPRSAAVPRAPDAAEA
jgi:PTS system nitrogen regulatory IIA component